MSPCAICGTVTESLETHHINQNRKNNDPNNLLVLCHPCHLKVHGWGQTALEALKLRKEKPRLTPAEISDRIEKSPQYTRNVLAVLQELGLVSTPVRGVYLVTKLGEYVLNENLKGGAVNAV